MYTTVINVTDDIAKADAITCKNEKFTADEILSTILLAGASKKPKFHVYRSETIPANLDEINGNNAIIYCLGEPYGFGQYGNCSNEKMRKDENGEKIMPYSSFGLLWKVYGRPYIDYLIYDQYPENIIGKVHKIMDTEFVSTIDARNSDLPIYNRYTAMPLNKVIEAFNITREESDVYKQDGVFELTCKIFKPILDRITEYYISLANAN